MKKIILAVLLGATLSSTSVFGMEEWGNEYPYRKPLIMIPTTHAPSMLELYESGKIDTKKGLRNPDDIWKPHLEFLDTDKAEWLNADILFAILDKRENHTFFRNGKCFQLKNINPSLKDDLPAYHHSYLCFEPLSKRDFERKGWFFEEMKFDGSPIYFEIQEVKNSNTKSRTRNNEDVIFQEMQQRDNKKVRKEPNEMDVI